MFRRECSAACEERQRSLEEAARQQAVLAEGEMQSLQRRLDEMKREQNQIAAEAALHRQRLALAQQSLERLESLSRDQFISSAQVQTKKEEVIGLQAQAQALERQSAVLARDRAAVEGERRGLPVQLKSRQGAIERDLAALARESAEQDAVRQIVVRAPQDGTVSSVLAEPGQSVSPASALGQPDPGGRAVAGTPVCTLGGSRLRAAAAGSAAAFRSLPVPEVRPPEWPRAAGVANTIGRARAGRPAPVRPDWSGRAAAEPMFRITVAMDEPDLRAFGTTQPLVAGMRMHADVLLERRRLIEWLFAPVLGLTNRL